MMRAGKERNENAPTWNLEQPIAPKDGQCTLYFGGGGDSPGSKGSRGNVYDGAHFAGKPHPRDVYVNAILVDRLSQPVHRDILDNITKHRHQEKKAERVRQYPGVMSKAPATRIMTPSASEPAGSSPRAIWS